MKLNSFKFQDGKILWLPEYPEKPNENDFQGLVNGKAFFDEAMFEYSMKIKESLASAIEVAPEDVAEIKKLLLHQVFKDGQEDSTKSLIWMLEKDKIWSAECEMEIRTKYICELDEMQCSETCHRNLILKAKCSFCTVHQVARLKLKNIVNLQINSAHGYTEGSDL